MNTNERDVRQPGVLGLEDRVPPELGRPACGHDLPVGATLEQDRFCARARTVREGAKGPCRARWEAVQHKIETFHTNRGETYKNMHYAQCEQSKAYLRVRVHAGKT